MSEIIYILIVIIIIAVIIVWYISSNITEKSNNSELALDTDEDKILEQWFRENKKQSFDINITNEQIVTKLIKKLYNFDVDIDIIIIGTYLDKEYYNITGKQISTKFSEKEDCILYLRSITGINYQVLIINSYNTLLCKLSNLSKQNDINLFFLNDIIESNLEKTAYDHLRKVLNVRWERILKTNDTLQRTSDDSFLYLKSNHNIPNLITSSTEKGERVNLLCNNTEFEALIYRLNSSQALLKTE